jgi:hypothetical protein
MSTTSDGTSFFLFSFFISKVLPSFFNTLSKLHGTDFSVIVRTFGTDGPDIAEAVQAWVEGNHPLFPDGPSMGCDISFSPSTRFIGRFNEKGEYSMRPDVRTSSDMPINEDDLVR